jgi:hypothetical protein
MPATKAELSTQNTALQDQVRSVKRRRNILVTAAAGLGVVGGLLLGNGTIGINANRPASAPSFEVATPTASEAASGTPVPSASELKAGLTPEQIKANHEARLRSLDSIYRTQGPEAWARAAGFTWDSLLIKDARQPEEETLSDGTIVISGLQVRVTNLRSPWTNIFTTDELVALGSNGRSYKPDPNNPSQLYTDTLPFTGNATIYADGSNWSQLAPQQ